MRPFRLAGVAAVCLSLVTPLLATAQEPEEETVTHIITVSTFYVPIGEAREKFMEYVDKYQTPQTAEDPYVLSSRLAVHNWGGSEPNVWMIAEYESLTALDQSTEWGTKWFDEHYPEGTPEREEADKAFEEVFAPYFSTHVDNILSANMKRAK